MPAIPKQILKVEDDELKLVWEDDHVSVYPFRALRLACPCAGCRDEFTGAPKLDPATVPADVKGLEVRLVGLYALSIAFSDGHGTGIYSFENLRSACPCDACARERASKA